MRSMVRCCLGLLVLVELGNIQAQLPATDERGMVVRTLNTARTFTPPPDVGHWNARQAEIRTQALFSSGLWPMPEKTPLRARMFDLYEGDGFTVEKVHLQVFPGVYLAGNLYRPVAKRIPFPAVLCPHGHWEHGRLEDTDTASVPARCIQMARMGMVVFSYDMIGYNDTTQFSSKNPEGTASKDSFSDQHSRLFRDPTLQSWNLSLMGQQVWYGVRALDFILSLSEVDPNRIAVTGASGGGTQTFMLAAIDDRVKVSVPAVMVSHTMQGGCRCENSPGLRVGLYNVDLAAAAAPRPQLLIGASGDWTKTTLEVEGPDVGKVYQLLGASDRFSAVRMDFGHNYNRASREALYTWLGRWFLGTGGQKIAEQPYIKPPDEKLRVFPQGQFPQGALSEKEFTTQWIQQRVRDLEALKPTDTDSHTRFRNVFQTAWQTSLALDGSEKTGLITEGAFGRKGKGDRLEKRFAMPDIDNPQTVVVLVHPQGKAAIAPGGVRERFAANLVARDIPVMAFDAFQTGPGKNPEILQRSPLDSFYNTYNRTLLQERVQDIFTAVAYARQILQPRKVILVGDGIAGLWTLLAAQSADAVVADVNRFDVQDDSQWITPDMFAPGLRLAGGFDVAAALAAPRPLWVHDTSDRFTTDWMQASYKALGKPGALEVTRETAGEAQLLRWIEKMAKP